MNPFRGSDTMFVIFAAIRADVLRPRRKRRNER
ncbi:hypothetical protein THEMA_05330 [Thermotoga maritima MSB8]|nr:hypothetical protein THEMA_05330 [Thermotoga maritima MSB8]